MKFTHRIKKDIEGDVLVVKANGERLTIAFSPRSDVMDACDAVLYKWKIMSQLDNVRDGGWGNCAFCQMFNQVFWDEDKRCMGCPVREFTQKHSCDGTPYELIEEDEVHTKSQHILEYRFLEQAIKAYVSSVNSPSIGALASKAS